MLAATRHDFTNVLSLPKVQDITASIVESGEKVQKQIYVKSNNYSYVAIDVRKTLFITLTLVVLDIVLFSILKLKLISFSGIVF